MNPADTIVWHRLSAEQRARLIAVAGRVFQRDARVIVAYLHGSAAEGVRPACLDACRMRDRDRGMQIELRDFLAGQYIAGVAGTQRLRSHKNFDSDSKEIAREAYDVADALLAERARRDEASKTP